MKRLRTAEGNSRAWSDIDFEFEVGKSEGTVRSEDVYRLVFPAVE